MKMRLMPVCAAILAAAALTSTTGAVQPLEAQQERTECRCVDVDGTEPDNCSCFRSPEIEGLLSRYGVAQQRPRLGVSVDQGQSARYDADGALVTDVLRDGPAYLAGIREGDVITRLNNEEIDSIETFQSVADGLDPGRSVPVLIVRGQSPTFLALRVPDE